ncbi:MAG: hypothetical protein OWR62_12015 [Sulfobacillus thermotolerans]|nr:hypothetical protein [Sulfobacillus thermotolerans]
MDILWAVGCRDTAGSDGEDRPWRANTVRTHRTHAFRRLGVWAFASGAISWRQLRQAQRRWWATIPPIVGSPHWPDTASAVRPRLSPKSPHISWRSAHRVGAAQAWAPGALRPGASGTPRFRKDRAGLSTTPGAG